MPEMTVEKAMEYLLSGAANWYCNGNKDQRRRAGMQISRAETAIKNELSRLSAALRAAEEKVDGMVEAPDTPKWMLCVQHMKDAPFVPFRVGDDSNGKSPSAPVMYDSPEDAEKQGGALLFMVRQAILVPARVFWADPNDTTTGKEIGQ